VLRRADTRTPVGDCVGLVWHLPHPRTRTGVDGIRFLHWRKHMLESVWAMPPPTTMGTSLTTG
jgi:hypothetical protein